MDFLEIARHIGDGCPGNGATLQRDLRDAATGMPRLIVHPGEFVIVLETEAGKKFWHARGQYMAAMLLDGMYTVADRDLALRIYSGEQWHEGTIGLD